jgi:hypothetical protein
LLATISSSELTEWGLYFEWKDERDREDREFQRKVGEAESWVKGGR